MIRMDSHDGALYRYLVNGYVLSIYPYTEGLRMKVVNCNGRVRINYFMGSEKRDFNYLISLVVEVLESDKINIMPLSLIKPYYEDEWFMKKVELIGSFRFRSIYLDVEAIKAYYWEYIEKEKGEEYADVLRVADTFHNQYMSSILKQVG